VRPDLCKERSALAKQISAASAALHKARENYDTAKDRRLHHLVNLQVTLANARIAELLAVKALEQHTKAHGCNA